MSITCISFKISDIVTEENIADKNLTHDLLDNMIAYMSLNVSSFIKEKHQSTRGETADSKARLICFNFQSTTFCLYIVRQVTTCNSVFLISEIVIIRESAS